MSQPSTAKKISTYAAFGQSIPPFLASATKLAGWLPYKLPSVVSNMAINIVNPVVAVTNLYNGKENKAWAALSFLMGCAATGINAYEFYLFITGEQQDTKLGDGLLKGAMWIEYLISSGSALIRPVAAIASGSGSQTDEHKSGVSSISSCLSSVGGFFKRCCHRDQQSAGPAYTVVSSDDVDDTSIQSGVPAGAVVVNLNDSGQEAATSASAVVAP